MTPPPIPNERQNNPAMTRHFTFAPLPPDQSPALLIEALLKHPGQIIHELQFNWRIGLTTWLVVFAVAGMALYGLVVGSFSGGAQFWVAPAKLALGTTLSVLICLPSLYIFACLSGMDARLRTVTGVLFAAVGLGALLLVGFAPVAWIFSQSSDSIVFMGTLHLILWAIGIYFGLRLIKGMSQLLSGRSRNQLRLWALIFAVVCLQMMTTLRPIIVPGKTFFPTEKKFFLANWVESLNGDSSKRQ